MARFSRIVGLGLAFLPAACGAPPVPPAQSANAVSSRERLSRIAESYWDLRAAQGVSLSAQSLADALANERQSFAAAAALPRGDLDPESKLTRDIFVRRRARLIAGYTYPSELIPIEPFDSPPMALAREAAKAGEGQLSTVQDYESWLRRIDEGVLSMRQAVANMREGARRGYTLPKPLVERMLPLLETLREDTSDSVFYAAVHTIPDTIKEPERSDLAARLTAAVKERLLPAYRQLHDFLQKDYLPKARTSVALSSLPLGASWYAYRIERATDGRLSPDEIHAVGLAEVDRIRARMQTLQAAVSPAAAIDPIAAAEDLKTRVLAAAAPVFGDLPAADFAIRAFTPRYGEEPMVYQPADAGAHRPAVLFVAANSAAGKVQTIGVADFLQAAIPGRHLQSAFQEERTDLPRFRRFEADPAFVEGWALYAATLGEEMGIYVDEQTRHEALARQLKCAVALVVDTGLHAKGWARDRAADYLHVQLALEDVEARAAADRYIAQPGDGLACKVGELKIRSLRSAAQQSLGARFDIREFHAQMLKEGSMPLDILDARMKAWMEAR